MGKYLLPFLSKDRHFVNIIKKVAAFFIDLPDEACS
jgi:hypothetical protein